MSASRKKLPQRTDLVLGIDAAWTARQPSGVCLLAREDETWRNIALTPDLKRFLLGPTADSLDWSERPEGGEISVPQLLKAIERWHPQGQLRVVAMDIPLARTTVRARRKADNEITRAYGRFGCGTHSPMPDRPGPLSDRIREAWSEAGFPLATLDEASPYPALLEVYPHPAVMMLLGASYRVPYKASRAGKYWPELSLDERLQAISVELRRINLALQHHVSALPRIVPVEAATLSELKRYEDALDAAVCAWVGVCYAERRIKGFGDKDAAIWIPQLNEKNG